MRVVNAAPLDLPRLPRKYRRRRGGWCYSLAGMGAMLHPSWTLVQGMGRATDGGITGHAWLERDGWAFDAVLDRAFELRKYLPRFRAVELGRWHGAQVAAARAEHGHWGPWLDQEEARRVYDARWAEHEPEYEAAQARDQEETVRGLLDLIDGLDDARLVALHRAVTSIGAPHAQP